MKFKDWLRLFDLRESLKDSELNRILDKISDGLKLTSSETNFLNKYDSIKDEDISDMKFLSKDATFNKIEDLLKKKKKVICDLYDKNGKIGLQIESIFYNYNDNICTLDLKGGEKYQLSDRFLYNLIYNLNKDEYSLQTQDEYFEEIPVYDQD